MEYKVYKLFFQSAVHFGKQRLESCEYTFCADTLFSALCKEAVKEGANVLQTLIQMVQNGNICFSDAFPYIGNIYFLPKPIKRIESADNQGDSGKKKAFKKLKYISAASLDKYLLGVYDFEQTVSMEKLGKAEMKVSAAVRGEEQALPYRIYTFSYYENNGLYFIVGYRQKEDLHFVEKLLESLMFSGIGGKRSAGLGRFTYKYGSDFPEDMIQRLKKEGNCYITLSVSLPREDELKTALEDAEYLLGKRSGFVASDVYADSQRKKKDLYVLMAGSCIKNKYQGDVYDVSEPCGKHPVYRYAKPLFMEVDL